MRESADLFWSKAITFDFFGSTLNAGRVVLYYKQLLQRTRTDKPF